MDTSIPSLRGRGMTVSDQLARHARTRPGEPAFTLGAAHRTYRAMDERTDRLAAALAERGVGPGDRVAVCALNALEVLECYFATARLGAIGVPVNFRLTSGEIAYHLQDCGAAAVVCDGTAAATVAEAAASSPAVRTVLAFGAAGPGAAAEGPAAALEDYEKALAAAPGPVDAPEVDGSSPAFIMYTSGTTGRPKGAVLTHHNLLMHAFSNMVHLGVQPDDRVWLAAAPLFHIAGLSGFLPTLLLGGHTVVLPSGRFDPAAAVDVLERERVTGCFFVPTQWQAICAVPGIAGRDLSALSRISWGAAPASTALLRTMLETFPQASMSTAFGQTECCPVTTLLRGEDALRKIGSVGTAMANVELRVVDDAMNDVARGEVGEIVYRSPMVMRGYWNKPAETAEAFRGGWFHSGDLVREDEDGYLYVVDRKKDMIISGGENIYCAEVEDALAGHPGVGEVAVVGVPHPRWGETPLAVVVAAGGAEPPDAEALRAWCGDRLARYKQPRHVAVLPELPRNPSGKVLKTELRQAAADGSLRYTPE
ncbi:long-chain-fatty-acid--CoA ligase [Nocardiopsis coralliicola]